MATSTQFQNAIDADKNARPGAPGEQLVDAVGDAHWIAPPKQAAK